MKNEKLKELESLPNMEVGSSITIQGLTADEVREEIKTNAHYSGVGNRVIEVGNSMVVVVRTKGRISKMKESFIDQVKAMHPFQRLIISGMRLEYARSVLKEYNEETGLNIMVRENIESSQDEHNQIEVYQDVFESFEINHRWTTDEIARSLAEQLLRFGHVTGDVQKAFTGAVGEALKEEN